MTSWLSGAYRAMAPPQRSHRITVNKKSRRRRSTYLTPGLYREPLFASAARFALRISWTETGSSDFCGYDSKGLALKERVFVTPALILISPEPRITVVGNLDNKERVISALRLRS